MSRQIKVLELELTNGIRPIWGVKEYRRVYILVRYQGQPLGWLGIPNNLREPAIPPERVRAFMAEQISSELLLGVLGEKFRDTTPHVPLMSMSVVVCTRGRTLHLERCLQSLVSLDYPLTKYEVIVIDSSPSKDDTGRLAGQLPVRYIREEQPGLNRARNRGIAEARNEIVAFIEGNAFADRSWLRAMARVFANPGVMAATGLIAPAELETQAQVLFEFAYGGLGRGFTRRVLRRNTLRVRDLIRARAFGHGSNMAFRRDLFDTVHPFETAFDVSGRDGTGGDIEMLHRIVASNHTLVYEPAALVWYVHGRHLDSLRRTVYLNSRAFGAYLLTCARNRTVRRSSILRFALAGWLVPKAYSLFPGLGRLGGQSHYRPLRRHRLPRQLVAMDSAGALLSPLTYNAARKHTGAWSRLDHDR